MTPLYLLPNEVLGDITAFLEGREIVRLWATGSRALRYSLSSRGGIKELHLEESFGVLSTSRLPQMVSSLIFLRELTISCWNARIGHPSRIWQCFSILSKIRKLSLRFYEAEEWMKEPMDVSNYLQTLFVESELESTSYSASSCSSRLRPLNTTFPCLEELIIATSRHALEDFDLAELPSSLTSLDIGENDNFTSRSFHYLKQLPRIQKIALRISGEIEKETLPKTTTDVCLNALRSEISVPESFWNGCLLRKVAINMTLDSMAFIPKTIEEISMYSTNIPRFTDHTYEYPNLKKLELKSYVWNKVWKFPNLPLAPVGPISLTSLTLDLALTTLGSKLLRDHPLPKTLQYLSIFLEEETADGRAMEWVSQCEALTSLSVKLTHPIIRPNDLAGLPPKLTSLRFTHTGGRVTRTNFSPKNCSSVLHLLPTTLQTLCISHTILNFDSKSLKDLPISLRHLEISIILDHPQRAYKHLQWIPKELYELKLRLSYQTAVYALLEPTLAPAPIETSCEKEKIDPSLPLWPQYSDLMLSELPLKTVSRLSFADPEIIHWTEKTVKLLNPNLAFFGVDGSSFDQNLIEYLPKGLHTFECVGPSRFTTQCFEKMPRKIEKIRLDNLTSGKDSDFAKLPQSLLHLMISAPIEGVSEAAAFLLPSRLSFFYPEKGPIYRRFRKLCSHSRSMPLKDIGFVSSEID